MNRIIIILSIVFLIVAGSLGYYFLNVKAPNPTETPKINFMDYVQSVNKQYDEPGDKYEYEVKNVGKVNIGKYADYDKYLFITKKFRENKLLDVEFQIFATKDYKNFITNYDQNAYPIDYKVNFKSPANLTIDNIPSNLPETIKLDENYSLIINSREENFKFIDKDVYNKYLEETPYAQETPEGQVISTKYLSQKINDYDTLVETNTTSIYINDNGVYTNYSLIPNFKPTLEVSKHEENKITYGFTLDKPLSQEIKFRKYEFAYKGAVAFSESIQVKIEDSEMELLSNTYGPGIYKIKNISNLEYKKIVDKYKSRVSAEEKPSVDYDKNINNGAILFMKNPFGKYIPLFEAENTRIMMGGGKPVIYLYPLKDTKISVKFNHPMEFANVVPNYSDSWEVLATPNSELKDLKPQITDCSKIKVTTSTTYAKEACLNNNYPYLYWSGGVYNSYQFPKQTQGFVVKNTDLDGFFNEKLSLIGLNQKEINDFKEFWIPELQSKNKNFFTISFLQNRELSKLFPMTVNPKPESEIRIFMDWNGYDNEPQIAEQKLVNYQRNGFTLVEWGGYKK